MCHIYCGIHNKASLNLEPWTLNGIHAETKINKQAASKFPGTHSQLSSSLKRVSRSGSGSSSHLRGAGSDGQPFCSDQLAQRGFAAPNLLFYRRTQTPPTKELFFWPPACAMSPLPGCKVVARSGRRGRTQVAAGAGSWVTPSSVVCHLLNGLP